MVRTKKKKSAVALTLAKGTIELLSPFFTRRSVLTETIDKMEEEKKNIEKQYEEVNRLNVELNIKMKQLIATQDMAKAILSELNFGQLLNIIMEILKDACKIDRAIIMLRDDRKGCLEYAYGTGFLDGVPDDIRNYKVPFTHLSNILARVTNTGVPEYVGDIQKSTLRKENILLKFGSPSSVYVHPLITRSTVIGVIAIDSIDEYGGPREVGESLMVFAPLIAIAIENARLYKALQDQLVELQKSRSMLSRADKFSFLSKLSEKLAQEIKEPIINIGKFIRMLPDHFDDEEFRENFFTIASRETNRVNDLIAELLNLVRSTETEFELTDLHSLIEKVILLISPHSNAKKINITRRFDPEIAYVQINPEKMKQAILNILSTSVDFSDEENTIEIFTNNRLGDEKQSIINITIKSDGLRIPENLTNHISNDYFNILTEENVYGDVGLGLFIANQNIQDHQGRIMLDNSDSQGATFIIDFPSEPPLRL